MVHTRWPRNPAKQALCFLGPLLKILFCDNGNGHISFLLCFSDLSILSFIDFFCDKLTKDSLPSLLLHQSDLREHLQPQRQMEKPEFPSGTPASSQEEIAGCTATVQEVAPVQTQSAEMQRAKLGQRRPAWASPSECPEDLQAGTWYRAVSLWTSPA